MKNQNLKNVETKENEVIENIEKVLKMPYTNETMIMKVKSSLKPLLRNHALAKKWSSSICDFAEISATELTNDREIVENNISRKVKAKSYVNALNKIKSSSTMLVGKIILSGNKEIIQLEKYIISISCHLIYMYELGCDISSWLYDYADEYNSSSYITLEDTVNRAYMNFITSVYRNCRSMEFEKIKFQDLDSISKSKIQTLSIVYDSLMDLAAKVLELENGDRLYQYKHQLQDFIRNITRTLSYTAGQIYMQVDDDKFIYSNTKKHIDKIICELEENVFPIYLSTLKYNFESIDKNSSSNYNDSLEGTYQNVKSNINSLISLIREN